jgi:hypothetical protein
MRFNAAIGSDARELVRSSIVPFGCNSPSALKDHLTMADTARDEIRQLAGSIRDLERQLEVMLAKRRVELNYEMHDGVVHFEHVVIAKHRLLKARLLNYIFDARPAMILTAPAIYALIIPVVLLDLFVAVYQTVCFPVYGIPRVRRAEYMAFDREQLGYLNALEKLNCAYCAYANGVFAYVREVGSRTEQYWCPIKHARRVLGVHARYGSFVDFGDGDAYRHELEQLRAEARSAEPS